MYTYEDLQDEYKELLSTVEIKSNWEARAASKARKIYENRARYQAVSDTIPWQFIGVIHSLESDLDFNTHLHNGDPLTRRTTHVPAGRPVEGEPPFTWEESAKDAMAQKGYDKIEDWSMPHMCFLLEKYNGFGYRQRHTGVNSPYLWSGTNHYHAGKFVKDGDYDSGEISEQTGCIPLLLSIKDQVKIKDLTPVSRKLSILQRIRVFLGTTVVGWFSADNIPAAKQVFEQVRDYTWNHSMIFIVAGIGSLWLVCKYLEALHLEDYKNGNWTPSGEADKEKE